MTWQPWLALACLALFALTTTKSLEAKAIVWHAMQGSAAKASPELVTALSTELGATPEQAAGAAGALFGVAKSRLKPEEFSQIAQAVPGMEALLKAAPAAGGSAISQAAGSATGGAAGLASAAAAFSKLGLKTDLVPKAVSVLSSFVTKSGGANVGSLLAGALK
jgi:hypothetical protein